MELDSRRPRLTRGTPPETLGGVCRVCGCEHSFANDVPLAVVAIEELFHQLEHDASFAEARAALASSVGKMIGVLVAEDSSGQTQVLRAYSGELAGRRDWTDWVAPVLRRADTAALEAETLARIAALDAQIDGCDVERAQQQLDATRRQVQLLAAERREAYRAQRAAWSIAQRLGADVEAEIAAAKREREAAISADEARVDAALDVLLAERERLRALREARRQASQVLSKAIYDAAAVTNARGERRLLREVFVGDGIAGGTTDCTVPKLLEAANVAGLRPIAIAEAWWGPTINGRHHGELQLPCVRKCQPILGYLLCGSSSSLARIAGSFA